MGMTNQEKGTLLKLFNRSGYVLNFSRANFDTFTMDSTGVALCAKYKLSMGKSLNAYIQEASGDEAYKLLSDLLNYYETDYFSFEAETHEKDFFDTSDGAYRALYFNCKDIIEKYNKSEPNEEIAKSVDEAFSSEYISQQIKLMLSTQETYPAEAIGKAKELLESCCRTILKERNVQIEDKWSFQQLVSKCLEELDILPAKVEVSSPIVGSLKKIYGSLKGIVAPIAEIRNEYGTGHGKTADFIELDSVHAKLLVGMSSTLVQFLWESHKNRDEKS